MGFGSGRPTPSRDTLTYSRTTSVCSTIVCKGGPKVQASTVQNPSIELNRHPGRELCTHPACCTTENRVGAGDAPPWAVFVMVLPQKRQAKSPEKHAADPLARPFALSRRDAGGRSDKKKKKKDNNDSNNNYPDISFSRSTMTVGPTTLGKHDGACGTLRPAHLRGRSNRFHRMSCTVLYCPATCGFCASRPPFRCTAPGGGCALWGPRCDARCSRPWSTEFTSRCAVWSYLGTGTHTHTHTHIPNRIFSMPS